MTTTTTCPAGHESTTTDYCDTCGAPIGAATAAEPAEAGAEAEVPAAEGASGPSPCPSCGEPVLARFCESCGFNVESGTPAAPAAVSLVLGADRTHWERMSIDGQPPFPTEAITLTFALTGDEAVLGRVRDGTTSDVALALTGAAADPGVSHHQCKFSRNGGSWTVSDAGSANGTWINDAADPLPAGAIHTLAPGDRILIGAWTELTVQMDPPAAASTPA